MRGPKTFWRICSSLSLRSAHLHSNQIQHRIYWIKAKKLAAAPFGPRFHLTIWVFLFSLRSHFCYCQTSRRGFWRRPQSFYLDRPWGIIWQTWPFQPWRERHLRWRQISRRIGRIMALLLEAILSELRSRSQIWGFRVYQEFHYDQCRI